MNIRIIRSDGFILPYSYANKLAANAALRFLNKDRRYTYKLLIE